MWINYCNGYNYIIFVITRFMILWSSIEFSRCSTNVCTISYNLLLNVVLVWLFLIGVSLYYNLTFFDTNGRNPLFSYRPSKRIFLNSTLFFQINYKLNTVLNEFLICFKYLAVIINLYVRNIPIQDIFTEYIFVNNFSM